MTDTRTIYSFRLQETPPMNSQKIHEAAQAVRSLIGEHRLTQREAWEMLAHVLATCTVDLPPEGRKAVLCAVVGITNGLMAQIDKLSRETPEMRNLINELRGAS